MRFPRACSPALPVVLAGVVASGCYGDDNGPPPPEAQFYYPTAVVPSPGGKVLYVVNSDFDLQYKSGTIQALDFRAVLAAAPPLWQRPNPSDPRGDVAKACAAKGLSETSPADHVLYPGPCSAIDAQPLIRKTVRVGAFAADALVLSRTCAPGAACPKQARLVVPVRGDPSLTWLDVDDDREDEPTYRLDCDADEEDQCGTTHRAGIDPAENTRQTVMPSEPFGIAASEDGHAIAITHQTSGAVSLFLHGFPGEDQPCGYSPSKPELTFVMGGLPTGATGIAAFPRPAAAETSGYAYQPGFAVSFRNSAVVDVIRYVDDCAASPQRAFLSFAAGYGINTNSTGFDSRGIALDPRARTLAESKCAAGDQDCLVQAAGVGVGLYVVNRAPATLLIGKTTASVSPFGTSDGISFVDQLPLAPGPSRVLVGDILDLDGKKQPRVFVLCFDSRLIFVYDPDKRVIEGVVSTGRGPAALTFDPKLGEELVLGDGTKITDGGTPRVRSFGVVGHFTDSYLGLLDLDMRHTATYLSIVATVGIPVPPRESK